MPVCGAEHPESVAQIAGHREFEIPDLTKMNDGVGQGADRPVISSSLRG